MDRPELSLRERKRMRTMATIQEAALRLFAEHGYDATTIEQIAAAADISPATFFRYYPAKDAVIKTDEFDGLMLAALRARPAEEDIFTALRATVRALAPHVQQSRDSVLTRARLMMETPGLGGLMWEAAQANAGMLAEAFAARLGRPSTDLEVRAFASAVAAASLTAATAWVESDGEDDLSELFSRAIDILENPLRSPR